MFSKPRNDAVIFLSLILISFLFVLALTAWAGSMFSGVHSIQIIFAVLLLTPCGIIILINLLHFAQPTSVLVDPEKIQLIRGKDIQTINKQDVVSVTAAQRFMGHGPWSVEVRVQTAGGDIYFTYPPSTRAVLDLYENLTTFGYPHLGGNVGQALDQAPRVFITHGKRIMALVLFIVIVVAFLAALIFGIISFLNSLGISVFHFG